MKKNVSYIDQVHSWGRIWNLSMMVILLAFPVAVCLIFGAAPDMKGLLMGLLATAPMYWAVGVIETFTFIPMLGAGGSYLSFVTGNISNLKLPVALNALEQMDVKINSEEGEVWFQHHLKIDNTDLTPDEVADRIIQAFGLVPNEKEAWEYRYGV